MLFYIKQLFTKYYNGSCFVFVQPQLRWLSINRIPSTYWLDWIGTLRFNVDEQVMARQSSESLKEEQLLFHSLPIASSVANHTYFFIILLLKVFSSLSSFFIVLSFGLNAVCHKQEDVLIHHLQEVSKYFPQKVFFCKR